MDDQVRRSRSAFNTFCLRESFCGAAGRRRAMRMPSNSSTMRPSI